MFGLDDWIAGLSDSGSVLVVVLVATLLGLRHATDPDHIAAVTTLVAVRARARGPLRRPTRRLVGSRSRRDARRRSASRSSSPSDISPSASSREPRRRSRR